MPKTNEEIQKTLEKQYLNVHKQEYAVYDKAEKVSKDFKKGAKDVAASLKVEQKKHADKQKEITAKYKVFATNIKDTNKAFLDDVESKKKTLDEVYNKSLEVAKEKQTLETKRINGLIKELKKAHEELLASTKVEYDKNIAESEKSVKAHIQKGEKDQASLKGKIEDLKAKFEQKITDLDEKEEAKLEKLADIASKKQESINLEIASEREKQDKQLATMKPIYEEELAEIDERIDDAKNEYETKYENIKTASDQRIAVREKHMHRAQAENDTRSVKQHKKDIDKFRKEAEKDLVLLTKNFNAANKESLEYRKQFVKENYEKLAKLEREYTEFHNKKLLAIENVVATLKTDIENAKLEFERSRADELLEFNKSLNEIEHKQAKATKENEELIQVEHDTQAKLTIEFNRFNAVEVQKQKEAIEVKEKEIRVVNITKDKEDQIAKNNFEVDTTKLDNEVEVANATMEKDLLLNTQQEKIENHELQFNRHSVSKNEFLDYQQLFLPVYTERAEEIFKFEEMEISNRTEIKLATLDKHKVRVSADYEALVEKINDVLANERAHYDKEIEKISGDKLEEFNAFKEEGKKKLEAVKESINKLDPKKDKKEHKALTIKLENATEKFNSEVANREQVLNNEIGVYKVALEGAIKRNEIALEEAKVLFDAEMARINKSIDTVTSTKQLELNDAKEKHDRTKEDIQAFMTKAASRNAQTTDENTQYLNQNNQFENNIISNVNNQYASDCEKLNQKLDTLLKDLDTEKQELLQRIENETSTEEKNLEEFKQNIANTISRIETETSQKLTDQTSKNQHIKNEIKERFDNSNKESDNKLSEKQSDFNNKVSDIQKRANEEKSRFDTELKRLQKEKDEKLKSEINSINQKLSDDIKAL